MTKRIAVFLIVTVMFLTNIHDTVYAELSNSPSSLDRYYLSQGYTSVTESIKDFENAFNQSIKLPLRLPSLPFTHHFGRFNKSHKQNFLEIQFINDKIPKYHYWLYVRPLKYKLPITKKNAYKIYKLANGQDALYLNDSPYVNTLIFNTGNFQYALFIDKRVSKQISASTLVKIANSIDCKVE